MNKWKIFKNKMNNIYNNCLNKMMSIKILLNIQH